MDRPTRYWDLPLCGQRTWDENAKGWRLCERVATTSTVGTQRARCTHHTPDALDARRAEMLAHMSRVTERLQAQSERLRGLLLCSSTIHQTT